MVQKVNGAAYPGIWVERRVAFIKATFSARIDAIPAASLRLAGTSTVVTGTGAVADSTFAVVESAVVQALKVIGLKATILGVSAVGNTGTTVDVMVGTSEGWFAAVSSSTGALVGADGSTVIPAQDIVGSKAVMTNAGTGSPNTVVGQVVDVATGYATFSLTFGYLDGNLPAATVANGALVNGPGASSGYFPLGGSSTGIAGAYPAYSTFPGDHE